MDITEISILHHACIVLLGLWLLSAFNWCHPVAYFVALIYLYLVHERYVTRLRRKLQFEEKKQSNQRRVLSDSESVRWLNHAVENIWPICMEQIASQKILLPIIPWFLEKYKPWTAKKAMVQHLYLGRNPPLFTEMRVLRQNNDDHLVLELGMNFLTADDMSAIIAVKLRKRLGFGMWAKLHITGMHVEGKVLVGVKFRQTWPFLSRLRVCFVEPPYFQMTVKPIFTHGLDVTEVPGIAGWLDKLLSVAFEQTLVEPNMLVVDVEKFASPQPEPWFSVDEKEPVAYACVEVVEGSDMKPSDLNGLADPYVKGHLGGYRFRTKIQKKTLNPKWLEEFKIPIVTWECANVLAIEVCDKDHFYDDNLGNCFVNLCDLRGGQRHDMWLSLQNIKTGRLHLAITILEDNAKEVDKTWDKEAIDAEQKRNSFANETDNKSSFSSVTSEKSQKVADNYEPIDVEGQKETGIWVHQPGSEVSQSWEPRKGKSRRLDTEIHREPNDLCGNSNSAASGSSNNDCSSPDDNPEHKHRIKSIQKGLQKIGSVFRRGPKNEPPTPTSACSVGEAVPHPHANIKAENAKKIGVHFVVEDNISGLASGKVQIDGTSPESNDSEGLGKGNSRDKAKNMLRHAAGKSARGLKHVLSYKSRKPEVDSSGVLETRISEEYDSSDDDSLSVQSLRDGRIPIASKVIVSLSNDPVNSSENVDLPEVTLGNDDSLSVQSPKDGRIPVASKVIVSSLNNDPVNSNENVVQTRSPEVTLGNEVPTEKPGVEEEPAEHGSPSSREYVLDRVSGGDVTDMKLMS